MKGLTDKTKDRIITEFKVRSFDSLADFYRRVFPLAEEMEALIRVGAFDAFGKTRTALFWESQFLQRAYGDQAEPGQGWLLPPPGLERLPEVPLQEPARKERLQWEAELLAIDIETNPTSGDMLCVGFSYKEDEAICIPYTTAFNRQAIRRICEHA